jgi:ABC-type multidrug transport system ATPase subunit
MVLSICLAIALPYFATTLVVDRSQRCTYVATSQGLPLSAYWVGTFMNNYIHFLIMALLIPACLLVFNAPYYGEPEQMIKIVTASLCSPLPMLLFAYSFSRVFSTSEACSKFMPAVCLMASVVPFMAVYIMTIISVVLQLSMDEESMQTGKDVHHYGNLIHIVSCFINPFYCLPGSFAAIGLALFSDFQIPGMPISLDLGFPTLFGSAIALPIVGALVLTGCLTLSLVFDVERIKGIVGHHATSRMQSLQARDIEVGQRGLTPGAQGSSSNFHSQPGQQDDDVVAERNRVGQLALTDTAQAVIYKDLVHTYNRGLQREVQAVQGISLAIPRGECFTLLGPNGAGKTTTLDVLTGAIFPPTHGEVSINGHSITGSSQSRLAALQNLGNCPQIDPLWPTLTGRQHLLFYGKVKGLPADSQAQQAAVLLKALGFSDFDADKPTSGYSGGMKRKLSLAIALIGSPPTLLLDEPSAAVDAAAKRHLWRVVRQREQGQTVILTTHSMEEAEALSDRLAIQVQGKLRCVGTPDHIKNTHGAGYQLELLVSRHARVESRQGPPSFGMAHDSEASPDPVVMKFITDLCSDAKCLEFHEGRYLFQLPVLKAVGAAHHEVSLAALFAWMQEGYQKIGMQDYSISRPSLEQVFIRFSKEQQETEMNHQV